MTDSVIVLDPSNRIEDADGNPVSGAKLKFFNAGTSTPKTVYSDAALGTSLGTIVYCDSGGYPVTTEGGSVKTSIYTGTAAYKLQITTSADVDVVPAQDNLRGASDLSIYSTTTATNNEPTLAKSANYTIVVGDGYKTVVCTQSGGSFTLTLPSAVTMADGWWIEAQLKSPASSNTVTLATVSAQTIASHLTAATTLVLSGGGSGGKLKSDGANWLWEPYQTAGGGNYTSTTIASATTTNIGASNSPTVSITGTTTITSFGTVANAYRTVTFTGALTLTHNATTLILPNASNITTIAGDTGIFVSDGSGNWRCWHFQSVKGVATQSDMEAASSTTLAVTAGRQHFHPGHFKAWALFVGSGTPAITSSYAVSSIADDGTGLWTFTLSTAFSSTGFAWGGCSRAVSDVLSGVLLLNARQTGTKTASTLQVATSSDSTLAVDTDEASVWFLGDQ